MGPSGINDAGQIIAGGYASNGSGDEYFLYSDGQWTDLGVPSGFTSVGVQGINNSGQIVGSGYNTASKQSDFVLYSNGQWTDLGEPSGYPEGGFVFINNSGQIVADAGTAGSTAGETHAFLYSNGQWTDLGTPDGLPYATAYSINNSGQIAGMAFIVSLQNSQEAAFLYSNGQMIDLNSLLPAGSSDTLTAAYSINDNGQIVAGGSNGSSAQVYLLTPQQNTGVSISNGTVSPATLTASSSGQQVTVSATINDNGSPATIGNVVFSLIGSNGTLVSDGPTGVLIGANGQASDTLTVPGGAAAGAYSLSVAYTNNGQNTTQAFTGALTISTASPAPVITANPSNQSVKVGQTATFTASASGSPTPTVQWQLSSDGGKTWTNVNLPSSNTITVPNVTLAQNGLEVRAVFTNSAGSETTSAATLTVTASSPSPTPPSQPAPTPAPSSPSIPDQIGQLVQDVVLMEQSLMSGDLAAFGQEMQDYVSLFVTVEMEIVQTVLNDLA